MSAASVGVVAKRIGKLTDSLSKVPLHITLAFGSVELGVATGFTYEVDGTLFLVTARHNVTGRHAETGKVLHTMGAVPDQLIVRFWDKAMFGRWQPVTIPLYEATGQPVWYEHPLLAYRVDAVAIPLRLANNLTAYPVNHQEFDKIPIRPGLDVFVLGFPRGFNSGGRLPIWKRGSIATEPDIDIDDLPKVLIDTATRQGLSGAPVIARLVGYWLPEGTTDQTQATVGEGRRFLGVYSGRVGDDEFQAQLGIVWKHDALLEIIRGHHEGSVVL